VSVSFYSLGPHKISTSESLTKQVLVQHSYNTQLPTHPWLRTFKTRRRRKFQRLSSLWEQKHSWCFLKKRTSLHGY